VNGGAGGSGGTTTTGGTFDVPFMLGADISSVQENNNSYVDTDGQTKSIFELLKNHGFNTIRVKAFVDPNAPYGYASTANGCSGFSEPFGDKAHVVEFGQQIKAAGMGFLLDFHYSDVWADPGNQIIPEAWRGASSISELAGYVADYTTDVLTTAIAAGARPDMVQVGNEITPGMLMHVPGSNTDCWGNNPSSAPVGGSTSNWGNLGTLIKAGADAVRQVDPDIKVMLHVENTDDLNGVRWWVENAIEQGVDFDVLGLSCYTAFQGQPSVWENTFTTLAAEHPDLQFVIAEYNPARTEANTIIKNLPNGQGLGTFFWEPTRSGEWGDSMFTFQGGSMRANSSDFDEYDQMLPALGLD
jgi:arabinogalactan endo-1,4-beta-galactosidase